MASSSSKPQSWVDLHRPRHLGEVLGNSDQVRKLAEWLRDFDDVVLRGKLKTPPEPAETWKKFKPPPENINARAVLVSGPPGIGKTTTCRLMVQCSRKYRLKEFNASDARSKAIVEQISQSLSGNHVLNMTTKDGDKALARTVLVMDECDGMMAGDRGGMQALINMIKVTKNPIICICNDRYDMQVRNLAPHCLDIKFKRPDHAMVAKRLKNLLESKGANISSVALDGIIEACGTDIRQVLNQVQLFGMASACRLGSQKDAQVMMTPFDACQQLLNKEAGIGLEARLDLLRSDRELMPLMIQENYLRPLERGAGLGVFGMSAATDELSECAQAAELIALGDTLLASSNDWSLQGSALIIGSLYPAALTAGRQIKVQFPTWLQTHSSMNRSQRRAHELAVRLKSVTTGTTASLVTTSYHDVLYKRLCMPLVSGDCKKCASMLVRHGLTRDFFTEQALVLRQPIGLPDSYRQVEGKLKTQLLEEIRSLQQQAAPIKRKRVADDEEGHNGLMGKQSSAALGEGHDAEGPGAGEEGNGDDDEDAMVMKKKKVAKKPLLESKKRDAANLEKCSLAKWRVQKKPPPGEGAQGTSPAAQAGERGDSNNAAAKKAMLNLRYIEGHTCAVRRRVHLQDLLGPWRRL